MIGTQVYAFVSFCHVIVYWNWITINSQDTRVELEAVCQQLLLSLITQTFLSPVGLISPEAWFSWHLICPCADSPNLHKKMYGVSLQTFWNILCFTLYLMDIAGQKVNWVSRGFAVFCLFFSLMCLGVLSVCMSAHYSTACASTVWMPKESGRSPGTELQLVVNSYVGAGNPTSVFEKGSQHS